MVPIFAALLPNGKVLIWDSVGDKAAETYDDQSFTRAAVYDPATGTSKSVNVAGANIFCAGFVQLANGNVFVAGGNADRALNGIRQTHTFDWRTETWSRGPDMQDGRWYPSVAALPNEEAVIVGGGPTQAEVRTSSGAIAQAHGLHDPVEPRVPFLQAAPDGRALLLGPSASMSLLDWGGAGAIAPFASRDGIHRGYGSYAAYDVGRFLVAGGGSVSEDGATGPSRTATVVDTRGIGAAARPTGSMTYRRRQSNLTLLADGSALVTGGQSTGGGGGLVDLANAVYAAERWDPVTETWTTLNSAAVARQYHSTALLLPDARVLTGGGGICGECDRVGYLRKDFEIFTPPYLFRRDGSGQLAARPEISAAPSAIGYDSAFTVSSPQAAQLTQTRARAARRADPRAGSGPALRPAELLGLRHDALGHRTQQPQRGAARALHAVRRRHCRRPVRGSDGGGEAAGGQRRAGRREPRAWTAGHGEHSVRGERGPREGLQRLGLRWALGQVVLEGRRQPPAARRSRIESQRQHLRGQARERGR